MNPLNFNPNPPPPPISTLPSITGKNPEPLQLCQFWENPSPFLYEGWGVPTMLWQNFVHLRNISSFLFSLYIAVLSIFG